jgi:hypothetical protein
MAQPNDERLERLLNQLECATNDAQIELIEKKIAVLTSLSE